MSSINQMLRAIPQTVANAAHYAFGTNAARTFDSAIVPASGMMGVFTAITAAASAPPFALGLIGLMRIGIPLLFFGMSKDRLTATDLDGMGRSAARTGVTVLLAGAGAACAYMLGYDPFVGALAGTVPAAVCDARDLASIAIHGAAKSSPTKG